LEDILLIDRDLINKIAVLAGLEIGTAEFQKLSKELSKILEHMKVLDEIDVSGVEPMYHACENEPSLREDTVQNFDPRSITSKSPYMVQDYYSVPNIITGEE
jgi:aspartyl-tRNA(Asn)/glutamyl-tRNA(Gln) amidotransferase subunit C